MTASQARALDASRNVSLRAGAGSGKTTVLVERYVRLLQFGLVPEGAEGPGKGANKPLLPEEILALTFTRKAAGEMRERAVRRLEGMVEGAESEAERIKWRGLLDALDLAPICTIHAFCKQTLEEFSLRAGLDPGFEPCEDFAWRQLREEAIATVLEEADEEGDEHLLQLAKAWERSEVEAALRAMLGCGAALRDAVSAWPAEPSLADAESLALGEGVDAALAAIGVALAPGGGVERFRDAVARMFASAGVDPAGTPFGRFGAAFAAARSAVASGERRALIRAVKTLVAEPLSGKGTAYSGARWFGYFYGFAKGKPEGKRLASSEAGAYENHVAAIVDLAALAAPLPGAADLDLLPDLRALLVLYRRVDERLAESLEERRLLAQDDLLTKTRDLLRASPESLATLRRRFRQIMVDEFQDTDPVQWEILRALAGREDGGLAPAKLFVVGDDKQSIYRFRGADVAVFHEATRAIVASGGAELSLDDNFRSLPSLLDAVNRLFRAILAPADGEAERKPYEARPQDLLPGLFSVAKAAGDSEAESLEAWRGRHADAGSVRFALYKPWKADDESGDVGEEESEAPTADPDAAWDALEGISTGEAVARAVLLALGRAEGRDAFAVREDRAATFLATRPAREEDVMVLLQARSRLREIERAFRRHGIEYAVEAGRGFFQAQEVLDIRNCLAFLADPRDDVALAGALRGPLFGLPDDALSLVSLAEGETWRLKLRSLAQTLAADGADAERANTALLPGDAERIVDAARLIGRWLDAAPHLPLADLVQTIAEESGALAAFAHGRGGAQRVANLDKLADVARDFERAGLRGVGPFVRHLDEMEEDESGKEGLAEVPATGGGKVLVMTVHGSKGREAPVVIVADVDRVNRPRSDRFAMLREQAGERVRRDFALAPPRWLRSDADFRRLKSLRDEIKAREQAESRRLFYVAATRARDHLLFVGTPNASSRPWTNWMFEFAGKQPKDRNAWLRASMLAERWQAVDGVAPDFLDLFQPVSLHGAAPTERGAAVVDPLAAKRDARSLPEPVAAWAGDGASVAAEEVFDVAPSAAGLLDADPERYYREVALGFAEFSELAVKRPARSLSADEVGSIVHRAFLEGIDGDEACRELARREAAGFGLFRDDAESGKAIKDAGEIVAKAMALWRDDSPLGKQLAAWRGRVLREEPMAFRVGRLRFEGRLDLLALPGDGDGADALLVDFKTSRVEGIGSKPAADDVERDRRAELLAARAEESGYFLQLALYALAAERAGLVATDGGLRLVVYYTRYGLTAERRWSGAERADLLARAKRWEARLAAGDFQFHAAPESAEEAAAG